MEAGAPHRGSSARRFEGSAGRQFSQTGASGTYSSTYDPAGRRTRLTHPDGFFVQQDYLVTGEMERIRERDGTSDLGGRERGRRGGDQRTGPARPRQRRRHRHRLAL